MTTVLIIVAVVILLLAALVVYSRYKLKNMPKVEDHEKIITLTDKNFNQQIKGKVVLVDFWATWCAPCRLMAPALNDLASELTDNKYRVGKVDVDANRGLAQKYNIRSIPTSVIFKDGQEVARIVGVKPKATLLKEMQRF
ncbi:MAG TPA: thioredoxin [Paludibacteraceae bacterium]|nr:thioredoxin [Paludibacteraceae bacterium]HPS10936.1 thioredoxin [Paludibacteraceae bacterium]